MAHVALGVGGSVRATANTLFSDARSDDPHKVLDPVTAWNDLAVTSGALPFSTGICGRVVDPASRSSTTAVNQSATRTLRRLVTVAGVINPAKRSFYDGRHTRRPVKAAGFDDVLRFQGQWADDNGTMGVYVVPPLGTVAAKLRQCFRELDAQGGPPT